MCTCVCVRVCMNTHVTCVQHVRQEEREGIRGRQANAFISVQHWSVMMIGARDLMVNTTAPILKNLINHVDETASRTAGNSH